MATLLLSIVLALTVWWIAIDQENPLVVQDFGERVPVSVLGLGENLVVVEDLSSEAVRLRLRAPRNSWQDLTFPTSAPPSTSRGLAPASMTSWWGSRASTRRLASSTCRGPSYA